MFVYNNTMNNAIFARTSHIFLSVIPILLLLLLEHIQYNDNKRVACSTEIQFILQMYSIINICVALLALLYIYFDKNT